MFTTGILYDLIYGILTSTLQHRIFVSTLSSQVLIPSLRAVGLAIVQQIAYLTACKLCRGLALCFGDKSF